MRSVPPRLAALCLLSLASCASDTSSTGLALNDPLDLIDDVEGPLRLFVLPAPAFSCDRTTGMVSPEVSDVEQGSFMDAVIDITLEVSGSRARGEAQVPAGEWIVLVRGKGTDPVTGVRDTFIATGCSPVTIANGETVEIRITLLPIVGMGVCGDSILSPDEQCEDGNTAGGDGCSATCRTEPFPVSTTTGQSAPAVGGAAGRRWLFSYTDASRQTSIRLLEPDGSPVTSPSVLMNDATLASVTTGLSGQYLFSEVAVANDGRLAVSVSHFSGGFARVRVAFFNENRTPEGGTVVVRDGLAIGSEPRSSVAFAGNGAFMVVFEDPTSATGLSGQVFAAGSTTALGEPFVVGQGATGATDPRIVGAADHFVVTFVAGGDVFVQRFGADGAARDASAVAVLEDASGTQDQPSVAAVPDGRALVTWREGAGATGDGAGSAIRARAFTAAGAPAGEPFVLNTTVIGDQSAPRVAGLGEHFVVVFQSGPAVRARMLSASGEPLPNREQPPTTADFEVAGAGAEANVAAGGPSGAARALVTWAANGDIQGRLFAVP
jgi:cysteine-rich repeat protein